MCLQHIRISIILDFSPEAPKEARRRNRRNLARDLSLAQAYRSQAKILKAKNLKAEKKAGKKQR